MNRQEFIVDENTGTGKLGAAISQPETWESGYKDTAMALPGQVLRIKAKIDIKGLYVWHCHILEHEENAMMRPFEVK